MIRSVRATRYLTPLREGGSLPAIVEADDDGLYVLKFRGAGQGRRALVAELISGEIARHLGLRVPELVVADLDARIGRNEGDPEIQALLLASEGANLGVDFLPGSLGFDPALDLPPAELASTILWFDALVGNVDRSARNPNMLMWHERLWLIDHGATLIFHFNWDRALRRPPLGYPQARDHVLLEAAPALEALDPVLAARLDRVTLESIVARVPDEWLGEEDAPFDSLAAERDAYVRVLARRLDPPRRFVQDCLDVRAKLV